MKLKLLIPACLCFLAVSLQAQKAMPRIFILGEDEKNYQELVKKYPQTLLEASGNDIKLAFDKWLDFLISLETYSNKIKYDLKGVKVWFHVFWDADGTLKHIGYVLQPDSKNLEKPEFRAILSSFMSRYQLEIESDEPFMHYSTAVFPVMNEEVDKDSTSGNH